MPAMPPVRDHKAVNHHAILDALAATRGGVRNVFDDIEPARLAHICVDMQYGFMQEGAPVEVPAARGIVGNINRISAAVRAAGGTNVFLRFTTPDAASWSNFAHAAWGPPPPHTARRSRPATITGTCGPTWTLSLTM